MAEVGQVVVSLSCPECGGQVEGVQGEWGVYGGCSSCWLAFHRHDADGFAQAVTEREDVRVSDA